MKNTTLLVLSFLSCILYSSPLSCHGRQEDALTRLYNAKFKKTADIDVQFYEDIDFLDDSKIVSQVGSKENDRIEKLPGQPDVNFSQYGGYVTVNEKNGRAFYYYFTESERSKESKPLLLWLTGGPGCSSLAYGAMLEQGPFRVHSDGKSLFKNPYAWNKVVNVLYLESPAGVGFSYTNTTSDIQRSGDKMTAKDNYVFLVNWLERYPEYKDRDFYISGESYAGHYVPQLAHQILKHNKKANKTIINLKGIIIGNAVLNDEADNYGMYDYFWTHALLSDKAHSTIHKYCDFSLNDTAPQLPQCDEAIQVANQTIFNAIDVYNIYEPLCHNNSLTEKPKKPSLIVYPCDDYYVYAYLNRPDVQKALHANVTKMSYDWKPCSDVIVKWNDSPKTILPLLREFMAHGLRIWVFSGDTDGRVPVTSTRYSLNKLNLPVKAKFSPWIFQGEVGGYTQVYKGDITFATVRGAGHQVSSYQPHRALSLIKHFLDGKPLSVH